MADFDAYFPTLKEKDSLNIKTKKKVNIHSVNN